MNQDVYIIPRSGTVRQAAATTHYILGERGEIKFILRGKKTERVLHNPRQRGLRYHVKIYRSNKGHTYLHVYDIFDGGKEVFHWSDGHGVKELLDNKLLAEVVARERLITAV